MALLAVYQIKLVSVSANSGLNANCLCSTLFKQNTTKLYRASKIRSMFLRIPGRAPTVGILYELPFWLASIS